MPYDYTTNIPGYEVCYFRNICNEVIPYPKDGLDYLPIKENNYYIPENDIVIYTTVKGEYNLCPIKYTIDRINNKIIVDPKYKKYKLYYGSRNQFLYQRIPLQFPVQSIPLPYKFRTGYNENNYFVFINGRLLNSAFYKVLIPNLEDNRIENKVLYLSKPISSDDTLDVFYIGNNAFTRINGTGDLVVKPFRVKATEPIQRLFKIPKPYKDYPVNDYNSFMIFKHGTRISTDKYNIISIYNKETESVDYYIDLLDIDEYLIYDDDLIFIFPYYKAEWETTNAISKTNPLKFITLYKKTTTNTNTVVFDSSSIGNFTNDEFIYVFEETKLLNTDEYSVVGKNTIQFNKTIPANTELAVVIESDKDDITNDSTILNYLNIPVMNDGQWSFNVPTNNFNEYFLFRNGELVPKGHYSISNKKLIFGRNYNDLRAGDTLTAVYANDGSEDINSINLHEYSVTAKADNEIIVPNDVGIKYTNENIIVFIDNRFISNIYYNIIGNTIEFKDNIVVKGSEANIYLAYKTIDSSKINYNLNKSSVIQFIEQNNTVESDNQSTFKVNYPDSLPKYVVDCPVLVFIRGILVADANYTITKDDENTEAVLKLNSKYSSVLKQGDIIDFVFCYLPSSGSISKKEYETKLSSKTIQLPYVYAEPIDLSERVLVFINGSFIESDNYTIDKTKRTITLSDNITIDKTSDINFVFLYTGSNASGSVGYVPQSGYLFFDEHTIDRNLSNEMMMVFVNGLLVPKSEIHDVSNSLKKITRNIKTRYDLNIVTCSPLVTEFKKLYDPENNSLKYRFEIIQTPNQVIKVSIDDKVYYNSFAYKSGEISKFKVEVIPNKGYIAGKYTLDGQTNYNLSWLDDNHTITATPATKGTMGKVTIKQSLNQMISVTCNGKTYNTDFEDLVGSTLTANIVSTRDGFTPGVISMSSTKITSSGVTVSAANATIETFTLNILNKNLDNQDVSIRITNPNTGEVIANNVKAPCNLTNIPFGSKFIVYAKANSGYRIGSSIGPYKLNQMYYIDYKYPLDNLVVDPVSKVTFHTVTMTPANNVTLVMYNWDEYSDNGKTRYECRDVVEKVKVADGSIYEFKVEPDYEYSSGAIISSTGELAGVVNTDISVTTEDAVKELPIVIISRENNVSEFYSIKVEFSDSYRPASEGVYKIPEGTSFTARCILHGVVNYSINGIVESGVNTIKLLQDGTIGISKEEV